MKHKVGDKVKIKSWEDMEVEYGLDLNGDIDCPGSFLKEMKDFCGNEYIINEAPSDGVYWLAGAINYEFTDEMFESPEKKMTEPLTKPDEVENDMVNHPAHYCRDGAIECIDEMMLVFGVENTITYCIMNSHKYRYRAADKNGLEDLQKSDWYYRKAKELMKINGVESWVEL